MSKNKRMFLSVTAVLVVMLMGFHAQAEETEIIADQKSTFTYKVNEIINNKSGLVLLPRQIDHNVALIVAEEYLPKYFPEEWQYFEKLIFYDLQDQPAAYAFMFQKTESNFKTLQELENSIKGAQSELTKLIMQKSDIESGNFSDNEKQEKLTIVRKQMDIQKESMYKWDNFVTVVTGATEISSLILDYYRGLPRIYASKFGIVFACYFSIKKLMSMPQKKVLTAE